MNDEILLKTETQRSLKLAALFNSGGWALFEAELKDMRECAVLDLDTLTNQPVSDLGKLNVAISKKVAIDAIFCKIAELQEEVLV